VWAPLRSSERRRRISEGQSVRVLAATTSSALVSAPSRALRREHYADRILDGFAIPGYGCEGSLRAPSAW
jgi:hypothetical protein